MDVPFYCMYRPSGRLVAAESWACARCATDRCHDVVRCTRPRHVPARAMTTPWRARGDIVVGEGSCRLWSLVLCAPVRRVLCGDFHFRRFRARGDCRARAVPEKRVTHSSDIELVHAGEVSLGTHGAPREWQVGQLTVSSGGVPGFRLQRAHAPARATQQRAGGGHMLLLAGVGGQGYPCVVRGSAALDVV